MPTFSDRLSHAWNAFMNKDPTPPMFNSGQVTYSYNPVIPSLSRGTERTIVTAIYNRIALDVAQIKFRHVKLNENGYYVKDMPSHLNFCLTLSPNKDQTARAFFQDIVMQMFDKGYVAVVPIDTSINPEDGSFDIESLRVGEILDWAPDSVKVNVYNDRTGRRQDLWFAKRNIAIIENPLFNIMNSRNSTLQRLIRKLSLLDGVDEESSSGKMNMIIQLPYLVNTATKKTQAEQRRKDIEMQLTGSKYGIAYADATEKITQLNRPLENNLLQQVEYLTNIVYGQLGMTTAILDGTADEQTMMNYYSRIIEPIVSAIADEMTRKYLTRTAITQHQAIAIFKDPFKLVPTTKLAELADKFTRNAIMSSNEMRQVVGLKPVDDPKANELSNKNINQATDQTFPNVDQTGEYQDMGRPMEEVPEEEEPININDLKVSEI